MPPTIAEIMQRVPESFIAEKGAGIELVVHFKFTGLEAGEWNAVIRDSRCQVAQGIPRSKPTITLAADSADFIRMVTGDMDGTQAVMDGKLRLTGDVALGPRLINMFRLPPTGSPDRS